MTFGRDMICGGACVAENRGVKTRAQPPKCTSVRQMSGIDPFGRYCAPDSVFSFRISASPAATGVRPRPLQANATSKSLSSQAAINATHHHCQPLIISQLRVKLLVF